MIIGCEKKFTTKNSDSVLCGYFGLYTSYFAGTLDDVEDINFYFLRNDTITYTEYLEKAVSNEECIISSVSFDKNYFNL
jgi:hypothetical protein